MKEDSSRHFYLYAKGHYQFTNNIDDLRILQGEYCGIDPEHIRVVDVLDHLLRLAYKHLNSEFSFVEFMSDLLPINNWKFINKEDMDDIKLELVMIKKCLSILRFASVMDKDKNIILNLGKADPKILTLKKKE